MEIKPKIEELGLEIGDLEFGIWGVICGWILMLLIWMNSGSDKESIDVIFIGIRDVGPGVGFGQFRDLCCNLISFEWALFP